MNGIGNTMNASGSNNSFPTIGEFEIGTFVAPTAQSAGNTSDSGTSIFKTGTFGNTEGNGSQFGTGGRNVFGQSQSGRPVAGPGIRETGIIEKLLVSLYYCTRSVSLADPFYIVKGILNIFLILLVQQIV